MRYTFIAHTETYIYITICDIQGTRDVIINSANYFLFLAAGPQQTRNPGFNLDGGRYGIANIQTASQYLSKTVHVNRKGTSHGNNVPLMQNKGDVKVSGFIRNKWQRNTVSAG